VKVQLAAGALQTLVQLVQLRLYASAPLFVNSGVRQVLAAASGRGQILADVFVVFGQPLHGIAAAAGGQAFPHRDGLWPVPGTA
jgi:hypothetical protein